MFRISLMNVIITGIVILSSTAHAKSLSILTYNVWAVDAPFQLGSRDIEARINAMPKAISETKADIVAFQEVWPDKYKHRLIDELKKLGYEYSFFEDPSWNILLRGVFGNGLLIVSKFPIHIPESAANRLLRYDTYTRPDEYFVAKGVLHVEVLIDEKQTVSLYTTHMGAVSFDPKKSVYSSAHQERRQKQTDELLAFVRKAPENHIIILAGDLNTHFNKFSEPDSAKNLSDDYKTLTCAPYSDKCLGLQDSYHIVHPGTDDEFTVDPVANSYTDTSPVYQFRAPRRTLDYIFISNREGLQIVSSKITLTENLSIPGREKAAPLSDHFGLMTTFTY